MIAWGRRKVAAAENPAQPTIWPRHRLRSALRGLMACYLKRLVGAPVFSRSLHFRQICQWLGCILVSVALVAPA